MGKTDPPDSLCLKAKAFWAEIVPQIEHMGILAKIDRYALARYCELLVLWERVTRFLHDKDCLSQVNARSGTAGSIPEVSILKGINEQLGKLEAQFGMTPSARENLTVNEKLGSAYETNDKKSRYFKN